MLKKLACALFHWKSYRRFDSEQLLVRCGKCDAVFQANERLWKRIN